MLNFAAFRENSTDESASSEIPIEIEKAGTSSKIQENSTMKLETQQSTVQKLVVFVIIYNHATVIGDDPYLVTLGHR